MQDDTLPDHILQIGFGFWASKTLLSAVELAVFSQLSERPKSGPQLQAALGLDPRATYDFLDTLVALGLLERDGSGARLGVPPAAQGMVASAVKRLHGKAPLRYVATIRERRRTGEAN